jgi:hypothetical protein
MTVALQPASYIPRVSSCSKDHEDELESKFVKPAVFSDVDINLCARACVALSGRIRVAVQFTDDKMATYVACLRATETATCRALMAISGGSCMYVTQN